MTDWLSSDGWGTREQAIPGEWAMLVLIIVAGGAVGFLVLWFTMLRHERTVLHRARARSVLEPEFVGGGRGRDGGISAPLFGLDAITGADDPADGEPAAAAEAAAEAEEVAEADDADDAAGVSEAGVEPRAESAQEPESESEPENEPEPAASVASTVVPAVRPAAASIALPKGQRKLTDEMLGRVEREMAEHEGWRWKDLATLVQREFGVSVHPSTIQRALKRRRRTETASASAPASAAEASPDPASA